MTEQVVGFLTLPIRGVVDGELVALEEESRAGLPAGV
jgi:hypothetical protein